MRSDKDGFRPLLERLDAEHYGEPDDAEPAELHGAAPPCSVCERRESSPDTDGRRCEHCADELRCPTCEAVAIGTVRIQAVGDGELETAGPDWLTVHAHRAGAYGEGWVLYFHLGGAQ